MGEIWDKIVAAGKEAINNIKDGMQALSRGTRDAVDEVYPFADNPANAAKRAGELGGMAVEGGGALLGDAANAADAQLQPYIDEALQTVEEAGQDIEESSFVTGIKQGFSNLWDSLTNLFKDDETAALPVDTEETTTTVAMVNTDNLAPTPEQIAAAQSAAFEVTGSTEYPMQDMNAEDRVAHTGQGTAPETQQGVVF